MVIIMHACRPLESTHTRYRHVHVDWSRAYNPSTFYRTRGYHGEPLSPDDLARIGALAVDIDLRASILHAYDKWVPSAHPEIPSFAPRTNMPDKVLTVMRRLTVSALSPQLSLRSVSAPCPACPAWHPC